MNEQLKELHDKLEKHQRLIEYLQCRIDQLEAKLNR